MGLVERINRATARVYDRLRHRAAFGVDEAAAVAGRFDSLRDAKYTLLISFRRAGEAVPSPVWLGVDDRGRAYVHTSQDAGKVKRIRHTDRVLLTACTFRGQPKGAVLEGCARVLPEEEWSHAEATLAAAYGGGRKLYQRALGGDDAYWTYVEITPAGNPGMD